MLELLNLNTKLSLECEENKSVILTRDENGGQQQKHQSQFITSITV